MLVRPFRSTDGGRVPTEEESRQSSIRVSGRKDPLKIQTNGRTVYYVSEGHFTTTGFVLYKGESMFKPLEYQKGNTNLV